MFDQLTIEKLNYYVYALIDPTKNIPFYVGKGIGNRVFEHQICAIKDDSPGLKLDKIRDLLNIGSSVDKVIIRHGLSEKEAFEIEASIIDFGNKFGFNFFNLILGHHSEDKGLMTTDEVIRVYNAKPLKELLDPVIIININRKYKRGFNHDEIYKSTKEAWVVSEHKIKTIKYALSEFNGIIIEVFEINRWYKVDTPENKKSKRFGFNGKVAKSVVRDRYINKSIAHTKKRGAANPIKYKL